MPSSHDIPVCRILPRSYQFLTLAFRILYIPAVNDRIFQLSGLTWQWGLVFGQLVVYIVAAELYKLSKRVYYHRRAKRNHKNSSLEMEGVGNREFHMAYTMDA